MTRTMQTSDDSFEFELREPIEEIHASDNGFHNHAFGGGHDNEQPLSLRSPSSASAGSAASAAGSSIARATAVAAGGLPPALRDWTERAYSTARQYVGERLGLRTRSSCSELEEQVSRLRQMRDDYAQLLSDARQLAVHVGGLLVVQRQLASAFAELSRNSAAGVAEPACLLRDDFACSHCTQTVLVTNGEKLLGELNRFIGSLNTLCNTAMTDTMDTVALFESSRLEYDARRNEFEAISALPPTSASAAARLDEARTTHEAHRLKYEGMCSTVSAKLKFLDDNRLKVMRRDLVLLHNATAAYFSGNKADFNKELAQFSLTLRQPHSDGLSWLEK